MPSTGPDGDKVPIGTFICGAPMYLKNEENKK